MISLSAFNKAYIWLSLIFLLALPATAAKLVSITTCKQVLEPDIVAMGITDSFSVDTPEINAVVVLDQVRAGATVKGAWISVDAISVPNYTIDTWQGVFKNDGPARLHLNLSRPDKGWPRGNYRLDLYVAGELMGAAKFAIGTPQDATSAPVTVKPAAMPPELVSLSTSRDVLEPGTVPMNITDRFGTDAEKISAVAVVNSVMPGTRVDGLWIFIDADGSDYKITNYLVTIEEKGDARLSFFLSRPDRGWPPGNYRLDLEIDGRKAGSAPFSIADAKPATPAPAVSATTQPAVASPPPAQSVTVPAAPVAVPAAPVALPAAPAPEPTEQQRIDQLLAMAQKAFDANRLTTPRGQAAVDYYNRVLEMEPGNARARDGISRIVDKYLYWYESARQRGEVEKANRYRAKVAALDPRRTPAKVDHPVEEPEMQGSSEPPADTAGMEEDQHPPAEQASEEKESGNVFSGVWNWLKEQHQQNQQEEKDPLEFFNE
ncbi:MAG: hypothetical protein ABW090_04775 [Sedimenticola sp.]